MGRSLSPWGRQVWLLVILGIALALPLSRLEWSFWRDEASSLWFARLPPARLFTQLCDPHPPGYYLFLKAWSIGGVNEPWLRWPSVVAAVLAVALAYRLGRMVGGAGYAGLAACLVAIHPLQSWYAAEARMYIPVQAVSLWLVLSGLQSSLLVKGQPLKSKFIVIYSLAVVIGLGLDYIALLPLTLLQLSWLSRGRPNPRSWIALHLGLFLIVALLWVKAGQLQALGRSYHSVFLAVQANRLGLDLTPASAGRLLEFALVGSTLAALLLVWLWPKGLERGLGRLPLPWFGVAAWLMLLLLVALPRGYTLKRQIIVLLPYLALLVAGGLKRMPQFVTFGMVSFSLGITLFILPTHRQEPWRAVITELDSVASSKTVVWVDELAAPVFHYYLDTHPVEAGSFPWVPLLDRDLPQLPALEPEPEQSLWLVTAESPYRHLTRLLPPAFHQHYQLLEERQEPGIGLYHYRRRVMPLAQLPVISPIPSAQWGLLLPSPLDECQPLPK